MYLYHDPRVVPPWELTVSSSRTISCLPPHRPSADSANCTPPPFSWYCFGFLCVCTSVCMYKHTSVCVCGGQGLTSAVIPQVVSPWYLRQGLSLAWNSPAMLGSLVSEGASCFYFHSTGITKVCLHLFMSLYFFLCGFLGSNSDPPAIKASPLATEPLPSSSHLNPLTKIDLFCFMCMSLTYMRVWIACVFLELIEIRRRCRNALELKLQLAVSHHVGAGKLNMGPLKE